MALCKQHRTLSRLPGQKAEGQERAATCNRNSSPVRTDHLNARPDFVFESLLWRLGGLEPDATDDATQLPTAPVGRSFLSDRK